MVEALLDRAQSLLDDDQPLRRQHFILLGAALATVVLVAVALPDAGVVRAGLAVAAAAALSVVALASFGQGLIAVLVWLGLLGLTRRLVTLFQADPADDPLLVVAPAVAALLVLVAWRRGAMRRPTPLALGVVAFSALTVLWVFNPAGAGIGPNVVGLLFWLVPMLWFWPGRLVTPRLGRQLLAGIAAYCVVAAGYGIYQAVIGFPVWDQRWIDARGYTALQIQGPDTLRTFGFSASAGEQALLLTMGILIVSIWLGRRRPPPWPQTVAGLGALAIMVPGLVFTSVRTAVVLLFAAGIIVFAAARGWGLLRTIVVCAVTAAALVLVAQQIPVENVNDHGLVGMVRRTVIGVAHPFDEESSTLRAHLDGAREGTSDGFSEPFGTGPAAATHAEGGRGGTEVDISDAGLAFGVMGMGLVVFVTVLAFVQSARAGRRERDLLRLASLGILVLSVRFWWNGGHYAATAVLWIVIGTVDRFAPVPEPSRPSARPT